MINVEAHAARCRVASILGMALLRIRTVRAPVAAVVTWRQHLAVSTRPSQRSEVTTIDDLGFTCPDIADSRPLGA